MMKKLYYLAGFLVLMLSFSACEEEDTQIDSFFTFSVVGSGLPLNPNASYEELIDSEVHHVKNDGVAFFIGYRQVTTDNKDPVLMRFDNGELSWKRTDIETSEDECKGYGLIWDGNDKLYAVFSSKGSFGDGTTDFRRFATEGWLSSYGEGEGAEIAVIAKIDVNTGQPQKATYISSELSVGTSNDVKVTRLGLTENDEVIVVSDAWYSPRDIDGDPMECEGETPFEWELTLNSSLSVALESFAGGCNEVDE